MVILHSYVMLCKRLLEGNDGSEWLINDGSWWLLIVHDGSCGYNNAINHPWLGMVNIPPIKMVIWGMVYSCFTNITFFVATPVEQCWLLVGSWNHRPDIIQSEGEHHDFSRQPIHSGDDIIGCYQICKTCYNYLIELVCLITSNLMPEHPKKH